MNRNGQILSLLTALTATGMSASCAKVEAPGVVVTAGSSLLTSAQPPSVTDQQPREYPGLHNVVAYHEGCYSGSVPEGDAGFDTLASLGVKTIISVDGAEPELAPAKARGIRYIHLPIGYNGFDDERKLQLVRATRDAMRVGPVYLHCHHGRHRSAGAAGTIGVSLGWAGPSKMVERMKVSGTSPNYRGLYACTRRATVIPASAIDAVPTDFPEVSHPAGFVKAMIEIDEINERLKLIEKSNWRVPDTHPDLVPAAEAGQMADLLRLLAEGDRVRNRPAGFTAELHNNGLSAAALEEMLAAGEKDGTKLSVQFARIAEGCNHCHVKYRD